MVKKPVKWDMKFIKRFMIIFGITSSVFDYITFVVLILLFNADEKFFQTGWMLESVVSAVVVMLLVRTARPFLKSKPSKKLLIAIVGIVIVLIAIAYSPINSYLGLISLPIKAFASLLASFIYTWLVVYLYKK